MLEISLTARHVLGVCLLSVVVMLWVASSFLMRSIFGEDKSYDKPFLVTWINTGTFSFYLIPWAIRLLLKRSGRNLYGIAEARPKVNAKASSAARSATSSSAADVELMDHSDRSPLLEESQAGLEQQHPNADRLIQNSRSAAAAAAAPTSGSIRTFGSQDAQSSDEDLEPLTTVETAKLGCIFSLLWFAANYFGNVSLSYTNVASFTIISSLSGFFTLALGSVLGVENFTIAKLVALIVSIVGVILVTTQDTSSSDSDEFFTDLIIGDILALIGAALYGCYTVFLKYRVRNEERVSMPLFFGFVGIFNLVVLWPMVIILNLTGAEPFELPSTRTIWLVVATNAAITFVSDYLWVLAMLMTSPLVVTVGISMSIPLALLGDHLLYSNPTSVLFFLGAALVFSSFIAINLSFDSDQKKAARRRGSSVSRESIDDDADED